MNPHRDLAGAMAALVETRTTNPLAGLEIVTSVEVEVEVEEFMELPDAANTRPPTLTDRYPGGTAEHDRARARLAAAGIRRGYRQGPAPAPTADFDPWSTR